VRVKEEAKAEKLRNDAKLLEEADCYSILLEKIPFQLPQDVSQNLHIPTKKMSKGMHHLVYFY
jgi:3-methyl-2-oxobutanoate hydroxymethyltransferase